MSHDSAEPRRHTDPASAADEPVGVEAAGRADDGRSAVVDRDAAGAGGQSAVVDGDAARAGTADGAAAGARPLSRRELRERERLSGAGDVPASDRLAADSTPGPTSPAPRPATPTAGPPSASPSTPRSLGTVLSDTSRYTVPHYLALALVACVLGYLVWSLATGAAESGASSARPVVSTTSPSAVLTATQGEL